MRIPWFSRRRDKTRGVTVVFRPRVVARANSATFRREPEYWRMCEHCTTAQATVYCRTHVRFYCNDCAWSHDQTGDCSLLSYEAACALAKANLCG